MQVFEVEPRGLEPLASAVQRRRDTFLGLSAVCKIAANKRIYCMTLFAGFQDIGLICCTVAAQVGGGHRLASASVTSGNTQHGGLTNSVPLKCTVQIRLADGAYLSTLTTCGGEAPRWMIRLVA